MIARQAVLCQLKLVTHTALLPFGSGSYRNGDHGKIRSRHCQALVSGRGCRQRWSQGGKRASPVPKANGAPPGLASIHWLANRALLVSLLIPTVLCVLELQMRRNLSRAYTALQDARTMQQLVMDSRAQLMAAPTPCPVSRPTGQGDLSTSQGLEPLPASPTPERTVEASVPVPAPGPLDQGWSGGAGLLNLGRSRRRPQRPGPAPSTRGRLVVGVLPAAVARTGSCGTAVLAPGGSGGRPCSTGPLPSGPLHPARCHTTAHC